MQSSHILRAAACAACLLVGGAAFAQGLGGGGHVGAGHIGGFGGSHSAAIGGNHVGASHAFNAGGMHGAHFNTAHNWRGQGWNGYGGGYAYGGYPYSYGYPDDAYDYGYYGYPYDSYGDGYAYDNGPGVYAQGQAGSYCQTPQNSCGLDQPSMVGAPCQCRDGLDQIPGTVQP